MPDLLQQFSQNVSIASKSFVDSLTDKIKSGISGISDAAKGAASSASLKVESSFPSPDFKSRPAVASKAASPTEKIAKRAKYAGALEYPAAMKYYTRFMFYKYERGDVLSPPKNKPLVTIVLPMPANLVENFGVEYQTPALGPVVGAAADSIVNQLKQGGSGMSVLKSAAGAVTSAEKLGEAAGASFMFNKPGGKAGEMAAVLGSTAFGVAPNPHLAVMFSNIGLREHSFSYRFAPNSKEELALLKQIIKQFKINMLPKVSENTMLFSYPSTCQISFHNGGYKEVPYKIKQCVMKSLTVNYAPNGTPAFFKTGDPVMVEVSMSFMEMSPFTANDVDSVKGSSATTGASSGSRSSPK
jgi:hypothetical protein